MKLEQFKVWTLFFIECATTVLVYAIVETSWKERMAKEMVLSSESSGTPFHKSHLRRRWTNLKPRSRNDIYGTNHVRYSFTHNKRIFRSSWYLYFSLAVAQWACNSCRSQRTRATLLSMCTPRERWSTYDTSDRRSCDKLEKRPRCPAIRSWVKSRPK